MFKKQSRVAPSVAIALTLLPPGWCSTVVVGSEQPQVASVTTIVDLRRLVGAMNIIALSGWHGHGTDGVRRWVLRVFITCEF